MEVNFIQEIEVITQSLHNSEQVNIKYQVDADSWWGNLKIMVFGAKLKLH